MHLWSYLLIIYTYRDSERCLQLFDPEDLSVGVASVELNKAPSLLIPYYDADSHTIFLTAKVSLHSFLSSRDIV